MIEMFDPRGDVFKEMQSGFCQTDTAVTSLKQENAKILFELFDPRADGGLTHAQSGGGMTKVQMLRDRQRMNQRNKRNTRTQWGQCHVVRRSRVAYISQANDNTPHLMTSRDQPAPPRPRRLIVQRRSCEPSARADECSG